MDEQAAAEGRGPDWFHRLVLFRIFPYATRMRRALVPARLAQRLGLDRMASSVGLLRLLPQQLRRMTELLPPPAKKEPPLPEFLAATGKRRARVVLFTGCVGDAVFRHVNWATARVLQANGCDVVIPAAQQCCGAIHFHAGQAAPARDFADANLAALKADDFDAVIVNIAGCGAMLKDYGHHWNDDRQQLRSDFAAKVRDIHEFLWDLRPITPTGEIPARVAYHDACHLAHAQGVRQAPRELLRQIPGLELVDIAESEICCGAAGSYNLTQPEMADRLSRRKLDHILATGARTIAAANAGCLLQIMREAKLRREKLRVMHPIEILDRSYRDVGL
jgi:glycolate oxidase iron-sulfur subunit